MSRAIPTLPLNDGRAIPVVGFGVWDHEAATGMAGSSGIATLNAAIAAGYGHL